MKKKAIYEVSMSLLAVIAVTLAILDISKGLMQWQIILDNLILVIFIFDYTIRLFVAKSKKEFIKNNVLDLIAIIPFNSAFRMFRVFKLAKLFRLTKISKFTKLFRLAAYVFRATDKLKGFLNTNGFKYMLIITTTFIFIGGVAIHYAENMPFSDGLWWAFVTATTVGYGDISPSTTLGRGIAMVLMLIGIGLIGSLTSTITSFFLNQTSKSETYSDELLNEIKEKIDNVKSLTDDDIDTICKILKTMNK